mgnify:CR=1 FL=1
MGLTEDQKRGYERTIIPGFQEDLTLIENVTIENIEKVLKGRFMNDNIYTAVGPLLFSVNPYRCVFGYLTLNSLFFLPCYFLSNFMSHLIPFMYSVGLLSKMNILFIQKILLDCTSIALHWN